MNGKSPDTKVNLSSNAITVEFVQRLFNQYRKKPNSGHFSNFETNFRGYINFFELFLLKQKHVGVLE